MTGMLREALLAEVERERFIVRESIIMDAPAGLRWLTIAHPEAEARWGIPLSLTVYWTDETDAPDPDSAGRVAKVAVAKAVKEMREMFEAGPPASAANQPQQSKGAAA